MNNNNNWEERFQEIWSHIGTPENWSWIKLECRDLFRQELTKKDQEHKAELEKIREVFWATYNKNSDYYSDSIEKGEMDNSNESAYTTAVLNQIIKGLRDKGIELEKYEIQKDKE